MARCYYKQRHIDQSFCYFGRSNLQVGSTFLMDFLSYLIIEDSQNELGILRLIGSWTGELFCAKPDHLLDYLALSLGLV